MQVSCDQVKSCSREYFPYSRYFHQKILIICVPNTFKAITPKLFNNNVHLDKGFEFFKAEFIPRAYMFVHIDFSCSIQVRKKANLE